MAIASTSTIVTFALVPLIAWRIYVRFRRATGRQRLSRYRGPITLTLYCLLLGTVTLANLRHPSHLAAFVLAVAAGGGFAAYALSRTKFEPTPKGLFYTPHGTIGVALALLFLVRLAYRLVEVYVIDPAAPRTTAEFAQNPLTVGAFGLLAGYYTWYMVGLVRWRHRVLRVKREREASNGDT
jgi:hypothetical protein